MGGAVAVHAAATEQLPTLAGLIVIDVVEGTAMEALASMQSFLRSRPKHFPSLEQAIEWRYCISRKYCLHCKQFIIFPLFFVLFSAFAVVRLETPNPPAYLCQAN